MAEYSDADLWTAGSLLHVFDGSFQVEVVSVAAAVTEPVDSANKVKKLFVAVQRYKMYLHRNHVGLLERVSAWMTCVFVCLSISVSLVLWY